MRHSVLLLAIALSACPGNNNHPDAGKPFVEGSFPSSFQWGVSVAGFQVEAGCPTISASECEDPNSDWYQFVMSPLMRANAGAYLEGDDLSREKDASGVK